MPTLNKEDPKYRSVHKRERKAGLLDDLSEEGSLLYRFITSLLLFGLLAEWLLPWVNAGEWSAVYHPMPLLAVIGCILIAGLFRLPAAIKVIIHTALCLLCMMWLYKSSDQSGLEWLIEFPKLVQDQMITIIAHGLWAMSGELRTMLLFTGWALLAPALQALMWMRQAALGVAALTAVYLIVLHAWLGMDIMGGLVRVAAEGLLLGAVIAVPRVRRIFEAGMGRMNRLDLRWLAGSLFLVGLIVGCAHLFTANKEAELAPAQWTSLVTNRLQQAAISISTDKNVVATLRPSEVEHLGQGLTGYGFDDRELGAAIQSDNRVIFKGITTIKDGYWRGEAKTVYDGRGWTNEWSQITLLPIRSESEMGEDTRNNATDGAGKGMKLGPIVRQTIIWEEPAAAMPLLSTGVLGRVTDMVASDPRRKLGSYRKDGLIDALYAPSEATKLERYTVEGRLPIMNEAELRALEKSAQPVGNAVELEPYLQLPESLPGRVAALAAEVAGGGLTSRYDQVRAVEQFLRSSYTYTMEDSRVPAQGSDFVDDFLFEQRQGYCVHFSSAMVVMLRAQEIPARWVKGFTSGTLLADGSGSNGRSSSDGRLPADEVEQLNYEVRASNAHAWVEVYFPGAGWVPFDPTPGFNGVAAVVASSGSGGGLDAPGAAGADTGGEARFAARFDAAAVASTAARWADALVQAAQSAAIYAAAAMMASPAAVAAAGAAAIALAAAAAAVVQRKRLRLALALRRYSAAYASSVACADSGSGSAAALPPRRSAAYRRQATELSSVDERLRQSYVAVASLLMERLRQRIVSAKSEQARIKQRRPQQTAREYAASLQSELDAENWKTLQRIVTWLEEAEFDAKRYWFKAPLPEELQSASKKLWRLKRMLHRSSTAVLDPQIEKL